MLRLLRAGTNRDGNTYRGKSRINLFCPKVLVTQLPLTDPALANRAIQIQMTPTSRNMPAVMPEDMDAYESVLVPKIHYYFFQHYDSYVVPYFDPSCLSPHKRDLARALAASYDTPFGQETVVNLLQPEDEDISSRRFLTREGAVIFAFKLLFDQSGRQFAYVREIAAIANQVMKYQAERLELTPKATGVILRELGYTTSAIGSGGRGIWMTQEVAKMTYNLARFHGVVIVPPTDVSKKRPSQKEKNPKGGNNNASKKVRG
jgi:hypothetical protein